MNRFKGKKLLLLGGVRQACEIVKEAHKLGVVVYVTDNRADSPAKEIADYSFMVDATDVDAVVELCKEQQIDGVITGFVDMLLPYCQQICEKLGKPFWGDAENIDMCINKDKFKLACEHAGVPTVPWKELNKDNYVAELDSVKVPVVIKPVDNSGSRGVVKCYEQNEVLDAVEKALSFSPSGKVLVEKCMNIHNEFSAYYIMNHGNYYLTCLGDRFVTEVSKDLAPVGRGMICPSRHLDLWMKEVDGAIKTFFDENNMKNGFAFFQGFYDEDDNKMYVHEIGYRLVGGFSFKYVEYFSNFNRIGELIKFSLSGSMDQSEIEKSNPYFDGYAITVTASLKPGVIKTVKGFDTIQAMDGVLHMLQMHTEGEEIKESMQGTLASVLTYILCVVKNKEEIVKIIDAVNKELVVLDTNGNSMLNDIIDPSEIGI
ncbi:MAG: hypothetical protein IJB68_05680 [Ruminococcus sp.]|nr:hypothetical protein [Ruminococcus sp.]